MRSKPILPNNITLINDYQHLKSLRKLAEKYNVSYSYMNKYFNSNNLEYEKPKNVKLDRDTLTRDYNTLRSFRKVAKKHNVSKETIRKYIHLYNIKYNELVRYYCNHSFFNKDNEISFYLAGFLAADGCIFQKKSSYYLNLYLGAKDKDFLEKIKDILCATVPTTKRNVFNKKANKTYETYGFQITSKQIFNDLKRFNITPRKSLTYKFPKWLITHHLVHHFMRGYFDGDGCVCTRSVNKKTGLKQIGFSILGTINFVKAFEFILRKNNNIHKSNPRKIKNIYELRYGGNMIVSKIHSYLYKNANIFLKRKEEKFYLKL